MWAYSKGPKSIDTEFTSEINLLEISSILLILNASKMLWDFICQWLTAVWRDGRGIQAKETYIDFFFFCIFPWKDKSQVI